MKRWIRWITPTTVLALVAGLTCMARAEDPAAPSSAEPAPVDYGMKLLDAAGLKGAMDALHLKAYGWVEQSFTYNPDNPNPRINMLRVFDDRSNDYRFNQLVTILERPLADGHDFDLGGKVELMYGSDARFIHERGLSDDQSDTVQFDPVQFYGLVRLPVGNGVTVKFGKFVTTHGAEVIEAPGNALFSHSFLFGYAIPFTHSGVQIDYSLNDHWGVYYALVQGWNVWDDNNNELSHMFGGSYKKDKVNVFFNVITGPEQPGDTADYRTVFDVTGTYQWTEQFSTTVNFDYGYEENIPAADNYWVGVAGYATYKVNSQLSATVRGEYFRDATGTCIGFPGDMYEATFGLDIHPIKKLMNLRVRPEVRWDHAAGDRPFDGGTDHDQFTIGGDVIFTF